MAAIAVQDGNKINACIFQASGIENGISSDSLVLTSSRYLMCSDVNAVPMQAERICSVGACLDLQDLKTIDLTV